jgi:hypothetical protein
LAAALAAQSPAGLLPHAHPHAAALLPRAPAPMAGRLLLAGYALDLPRPFALVRDLNRRMGVGMGGGGVGPVRAGHDFAFVFELSETIEPAPAAAAGAAVDDALADSKEGAGAAEGAGRLSLKSVAASPLLGPSTPTAAAGRAGGGGGGGGALPARLNEKGRFALNLFYWPYEDEDEDDGDDDDDDDDEDDEEDGDEDEEGDDDDGGGVGDDTDRDMKQPDGGGATARASVLAARAQSRRARRLQRVAERVRVRAVRESCSPRLSLSWPCDIHMISAQSDFTLALSFPPHATIGQFIPFAIRVTFNARRGAGKAAAANNTAASAAAAAAAGALPTLTLPTGAAGAVSLTTAPASSSVSAASPSALSLSMPALDLNGAGGGGALAKPSAMQRNVSGGAVAGSAISSAAAAGASSSSSSGSGVRRLSLMCEVVADPALWLVSGRSKVVFELSAGESTVLSLKLLPIAAGYLPLPTVDLRQAKLHHRANLTPTAAAAAAPSSSSTAGPSSSYVAYERIPPSRILSHTGSKQMRVFPAPSTMCTAIPAAFA